MYNHVVLFTLKDPAQAGPTRDKLLSMRGRVPSLKEIEVGVNEPDLPRNVHLALITRFQDKAAYEAYRVDAEHKKILAHMGAVAADAQVVDWTS